MAPSFEHKELTDRPMQYHLLQIKIDTDYKPQKKSNLPVQFSQLTARNNTRAFEMIEAGEIQRYNYEIE